MAISISLPTIGGNEDTWGSTINTGLTAIQNTLNGSGTGKVTVAPDLSALTINGTAVSSTAAELNKLDGFTGNVADLNYAKDLKATGVTATEFDKLDGLTATTTELNKIDGFTGTATDLNYAKDLRATGVTTTEFDLLDGAAAGTVANNKAVIYNGSGGVVFGNWTITESSGSLFFQIGGVSKMKLDASGNLTVTGNVTAFGSV